MNPQRRKQLQNVLDYIDKAKEALYILKEEEQDYFDKMPDSIQDSDKGEKSNDAISNMEDAYSLLDDAMNSITDAQQ
jgi:hypothetical protein